MYRLTTIENETESIATVSFSYPPIAEADHKNSHQITSVFYNRDFSFFNFQFGPKQRSNFETFDFEMKETKINPPGSVITFFKIFTVKREYGEKLTGLRFYDADNKVLLSVGWFDDATCTLYRLKPSERITGIEGKWSPERKCEPVGTVPP